MNPALDPTRSAAVLASAGTGKTWTLTGRIVRLLLAGAAPGGILALTFTRKAAAEMRERVVARLQQLAYADEAGLSAALAELEAPDDAPSRERARALFEDYVHAELPLRASTLHAFCQELLSRFPLEAGVPAGFSLAEREDEWLGQAVEQLLAQLHRNPDSAEALALQVLAEEGVGEWELRDSLRGLLQRRAEIWAATEHSESPLESLCAALAARLPWSEDEDVYGAIDADSCGFRISMLHGLLHELGDTQYLKAARLADVHELHGAERLAALLTALYKKDGSAPYSFKPQKKLYTEEQAATALEHHAVLLDAIAQALQAQRRHSTYRRTRAALTLGLAAIEALGEILRRANALLFPELEWQTCRLLSSAEQAEWVRYKLDARVEHLLLDEFQDTSPLQWRLLKPMLDEFASDPARGRSAFVVGDAKQSIYGFRRAEPQLLELAAQTLETRLAAVRLPLNASQRSAPAIIDFVNALFAADTGTRIGFDRHETRRDALHGAVEVAPLFSAAELESLADAGGLRNPLLTPRETGEDRRAAQEGEWLAERIQTLVAARTPVTERDGRSRPLRYDDVMVLSRQRRHLGAIERALGAAGVPYLSATRGTLLDTALAQDLLALLTVLDAPHQDLALAQALRSPLFSVDDADLLALAQRLGPERRSWFASLADCGERPALARANQLLNRWRGLARRLPPHDLLDRIADEGDLVRRCRAARPADSAVAANLAALLQLALDSDHGRYPTLAGFLRHCAGLRGDAAPDEAPPAGGEARVRVMTVHAAKGLEAPAVFLVNAAPGARAARAGWRIEWPVGAAAPGLVVLTGSRDDRDPLSQSLVDAEQAREQREDLNLLYVAVTRARQYLFVSGFAPARGEVADSWHARCAVAVQQLASAANEAPDDGLPRSVHYASGALPSVQEGAPAAVPPPLDLRLLRPLQAAPAAPATGLALDAGAVLRGQLVHALLQALGDGVGADRAGLAARVARQLGLSPPAPLYAAALAEAEAVLAAPELRRFFAPGLRAWNEVALPLALAEGLQLNVLDRLVDDGERLWVLDYKTHRAGDAAAVLAGAAEQLRRYVAAVQRLWPDRPVSAGVIWTPTARWLPLPESP
ncbi:MAG: UvrD-helicase domain-containing protein [Stagnimonas sp.]|nr:UvrD-helicase domain-containing protein [Stagnimonas sp.]